jgi:hypothetical protein
MHKVSVGKPEGKRPLGRPRYRRENGSDWLRGCGVDSVGSGYVLVAGSYEHGDEPLLTGSTELVLFP